MAFNARGTDVATSAGGIAFASIPVGTNNMNNALHMPRHIQEAESNRHPGLSDPARAIGATLIVLSLLRWPLTAIVASSASKLPISPWIIIPAMQASAEAMFWVGVYMVGRKPLRAALARLAGTRPVRILLARRLSLSHPVEPSSAISDD
jgi:hypothetical protein